MSFFLRFFSNYFESGMGFQIVYESSNVFQGMIDKFEECGGGYYSQSARIEKVLEMCSQHFWLLFHYFGTLKH